jgi:hypothetical protein
MDHQAQHVVVATKTPEQQSCLMLHRTRHLLIRKQIAATNATREPCRVLCADLPKVV